MLRYLFCVLLMPVAASPALAQNLPVEEVSLTVRNTDLDDPAQAREIYARLEDAAHKACDAAPRHDVAVEAANAACRKDALAAAVRHLDRPALTAVLADARRADAQAETLKARRGR